MKLIKTILIGCAWCKKVIGFKHCETEDANDLACISHGMCQDCSDQVFEEFDLEEDSEKESKEKDEEELESESS